MARLTMTTIAAIATTRPITMRDVALGGGGHRDLAEAGIAKTCSTMTAPHEQADEQHGQHRQRGAAGVPQHVLVDDAAEAEAAAAQRPDVVLAQRVDHRDRICGVTPAMPPMARAMIGRVTDATQPEGTS